MDDVFTLLGSEPEASGMEVAIAAVSEAMLGNEYGMESREVLLLEVEPSELPLSSGGLLSS